MKAPSAGPTSLLILHAIAGAGHTRAAQASAAALQPSGHPHRVVDTLDCTSAIFRRLYVKSYIKLVPTAPERWGYFYEKSDTAAARAIARPDAAKEIAHALLSSIKP